MVKGRQVHKISTYSHIMRPSVYTSQFRRFRVSNTDHVEFQNVSEPRPQDGHQVSVVAGSSVCKNDLYTLMHYDPSGQRTKVRDVSDMSVNFDQEELQVLIRTNLRG